MNYIIKLKEYYYKIFFKKEQLIKLKVNEARKRGVKIGSNMRCFSNPISAEPYLLEFGDNVTISSNVYFITHDNSVIKIFEDATDVLGKIKIGNNVFLGFGSIILPGITIGDNTIIASGSVVTKSFKEGNVIIGGNPAKVLSTIESYKSKTKDKIFDLKNLDYNQKRKIILQNEKKYLRK